MDRTDLDGATSRGPVEGLAVVAKVVAEVDAALDVGRTVRTGERNLGSVARMFRENVDDRVDHFDDRMDRIEERIERLEQRR